MSEQSHLHNLTETFSSIFLIALLPPIIFESGYSMNKVTFFKNGGTILLYSFVGTFIAIFTSSVLFWTVGQTPLGPVFSWKEAFVFGSLISATDPVSVLAIFKEMDADRDLNAIIFGESIFNDAVAIVMYEIVMMSGTKEGSSFGSELIDGCFSFVVIFAGSLLIGALMALLISFILKYQRYDQSSETSLKDAQAQAQQRVKSEISMMLMCPWLSYILASGLQLSGIVSILTNGAFLSYYATPSITQSSKRVLSTIYEVAAYSAETIVFLYLGIGLFAFNSHYYETISWGFCFTTILNLNLARLLNIGIVTYLANLTRKESKISYKT